MKTTILCILISLFVSQQASAAAPENIGNVSNQRIYRDYRGMKVKKYLDQYYSFRIGAAFTDISSENEFLDNNSKTGLNVAFIYGFGLTTSAPLYFETGMSYTEKGGKTGDGSGKRTYNLNYLELPFGLKYIADTGVDLTIQPFFGGFFACGVGGSIKDYATRTAYSSFSDNEDAFRRFDAGLRMGCGLAYDLIYFELAYELGLANITHDSFNTAHNHALMLNVGVTF